MRVDAEGVRRHEEVGFPEEVHILHVGAVALEHRLDGFQVRVVDATDQDKRLPSGGVASHFIQQLAHLIGGELDVRDLVDRG